MAQRQHATAVAQRLSQGLPGATWRGLLALAAAGTLAATSTNVAGDAKAADPGPPAAQTISAATIQIGLDGTVKIMARVCGGLHQAGSGFPVSTSQVVTNAHVVAGSEAISVTAPSGRQVMARVVLFDPARDLAVLSAPGLGLRPLAVAATSVESEVVAVGYPAGAAEQATIGDAIPVSNLSFANIYGQHAAAFDVLRVSATLHPGNSGGPVIGTTGSVIGVVFASSRGEAGVAFAISGDELSHDMSLAANRTQPVSTGPCI